MEGCFFRSSCLELSLIHEPFFVWFSDPKFDAVSVVATQLFLEFVPLKPGDHVPI